MNILLQQNVHLINTAHWLLLVHIVAYLISANQFDSDNIKNFCQNDTSIDWNRSSEKN